MATKEVTAIKVLLKNSRGEYLIPYTEEKFDIDAHTQNVLNPHNVTKEQIGLGNVDNTTDANKPVSSAQKSYVDNFLLQARQLFLCQHPAIKTCLTKSK